MPTLRRKISVPPNPRQLSRLRQTVVTLASAMLIPEDKAHLISLAVDEALANIIQHGFESNAPDGGNAREPIELRLHAESGRFEVRIRDNSEPFDPRQAPDIDLQHHLRARRTRGLGIYIMRRVMDEIHYQSSPGSPNELRMVKYIDPKKGKG